MNYGENIRGEGLEYDVSEGDSGEVEKKYAHAMCRRN